MRTDAIDRPRIALIHAVAVAMGPIKESCALHWPEADCINLLDDSLSPDRALDTDLTPALAARIGALADYALELGSQGILFTCSAFGEAIEAVAARAPVPVMRPNEAMFEAALDCGLRIGMLATFRPSMTGMEAELNAAAAARGLRVDLRGEVVPEAMAALQAGEVEVHNGLLADRAVRLADCDVVMLAHFSTSRAQVAVQERLTCPVLTSPDSAILKLRALIAPNRLES
jgi:hypothetical protein